MKNIFKYTFTTVADIKKFLFIILVVSILTLIEAFPVISIIGFIFEKLIYLSIGVLLIYIVKTTNNEDEFFNTLKKQSFLTFLIHFFPVASGIMLGIIVIFTFFATFFIIILQFSNSLFILANPHNILISLSKINFIAQLLIGLYSVYLLFFSYIFLGKLGEALSKENFKEGFLSTISSIIDFKFWIKSFNFKYLGIYFVWSIIVFTIYALISFTYIFYIFPLIIQNPNFSLIIIPLLVAITTIVTYFTFFSAYFAYKSTI